MIIFNSGKIGEMRTSISYWQKHDLFQSFQWDHVVACMKSLNMYICSKLAIPLLGIYSLKVYSREHKNTYSDLYKDVCDSFIFQQNPNNWTQLSNYTHFPGGSDSKASACNAGDLGSIPGSGRSPGEGNGNLLQYSCLENSMDRGTQQAMVIGLQRVGHY